MNRHTRNLYTFLQLLVVLVFWGCISSGSELSANNSPVEPMLSPVLEQLMTTNSSGEKSLTSFVEQTSTSAGFEDAGTLPFSLTVDGLGSDDVREIGRLAGEARRLADKMNSAINRFLEIGNSIEDLLAGLPVELPVGLSQNIGGLTFHLVLLEMQLKPTHAEVDVALGVQFPGSPERLLLGATDVEFSREGGFGDLRLELIDVFGINIAQGKSRLVFYPTEANDGSSPTGTYAEVTCGGLQSLSLNASLILSRDWALPIRFGEPLTDELLVTDEEAGLIDQMDVVARQKYDRVHWDFNIQAGNGDFFIETGSRDSFVLNRFPDVQIYAEDISLDFSDTRNPENMSIPANYNCPYLIDHELMPLWRGVYIRSISVQLPEKWRKETALPLRVYGEGIIIDERGFTGLIGIDNILPLEEGKAGGWAFSVDTFQMRFMQSQVEMARMAGVFNIPLLAKIPEAEGVVDTDGLQREDCVSYLAHIEPDSYYQLVAEANRDYWVPLWGESSLTIRDGTSLDLTYANRELNITATLFASVYIEAGSGNSNFQLVVDTTDFDHLVLSTQHGIEDFGNWDFPDFVSARAGEFEVHLTNIDFDEDPITLDPTLSFAALVEIGDDGFDLSAGGAFRVVGEQGIDEEGYERFHFKKFAVDALHIDMSTSAFGVRADIAFYEGHSRYGNGFYGQGELWFRAFGSEIGVAAVAQFGEITDELNPYKYFMVDALARLPEGMLPAGPFFVRGIGGGVWHHMSLNDFSLSPIPADANSTANTTTTNVAQAVAENEPDAVGQFLGQNLSGFVLNPNPANRFGLKVNIVLASALPNEEAMSINGTFQLEINGHQGWRADLYGNTTFFGPINWYNEAPEEGLAALFHISMVREPVEAGSDEMLFSVLGEAFLFVNFRAIRGTSLAAPNLDPDQEIPLYDISGATYAGYLGLYWDSQGEWGINLGRPIPSMYAEYDDQPSGPLSLGTRLLGIEASLSAYLCLGTDIPTMPDLPHYVSDITGGERNFLRNESLYATGRGIAFGAGLNLKVSPRLGIFFVDIAAGVGFDINLQQYENVVCAETGRPPGFEGWYAAGQAFAYLSGEVGMEFNLFLTRVRVNILEAAVAASLQMKGPNPFWGSGRIGGRFRVLGFISGSFRMGFTVGQQCTLLSENGGDPLMGAQLITAVIPEPDSETIATDQVITLLLNFPYDQSQEINDNLYELNINSVSLSSSNGDIPGRVNGYSGDYSVSFSSYDFLPANSNLTFTADLELRNTTNNEVVSDTTVIVEYLTGAGYNRLLAENVRSSYPVNGQFNLYSEESNTGFIKLDRGQPELFEEPMYAIFKNQDYGYLSRPIIYNQAQRSLTFELPEMGPGNIYRLHFSNQAQSQDGQVQDTIWQAFFRRSEYASISAKIEDLFSAQTLVTEDMHYQLPVGTEPFGPLEIGQTDIGDGWLSFWGEYSAAWFSEGGYQDFFYQHLNDGAIGEDELNLLLPWRPGEWGRVPTKAVYLSSGAEDRIIGEEEWLANSVSMSDGRDSFHFHYPSTVIDDLMNYRDSLIAQYLPAMGDQLGFAQQQWGTAVYSCANASFSPQRLLDEFMEGTPCRANSFSDYCNTCPFTTNFARQPEIWERQLYQMDISPNPLTATAAQLYGNRTFKVNFRYAPFGISSSVDDFQINTNQ